MKPDREEVLRMAADIANYSGAGFVSMTVPELERFYALAYEAGARAERERLQPFQPA